MKLFDKILLGALSVLSLLAVITLAVVGIGKPFSAAGLWYVGILGVLVLACAVRMLFVVFKKNKHAQSVLLSTGEIGSSYMSFSALEGVVRSILSKQKPIKNSRIQVLEGEKNSVVLRLQLNLYEQIQLPPFIASLQGQIKERIESLCGVAVSQIFVSVESAAEPDAGKNNERLQLK